MIHAHISHHYSRHIRPQKNEILKYSTYALLFLAICLLIKSGVKLGDLADVGLLIVAVVALKITKEQSLEWRRKECASIFSDCLENLEPVESPLTIMVNDSQIGSGRSLPEIYEMLELPYICKDKELKTIRRVIDGLRHAKIHMDELKKRNSLETMVALLENLIVLNKYIMSNNTNYPLDGHYLTSYEEKRREIKILYERLNLFIFGQETPLSNAIQKDRDLALKR
ncbi:hypothetical protein [Salinicola sp. DM10]|uniref:hypothetical protein n=1 Tax=Salinicola sp. DM10 TaxID=2815721 RepID=UPI001A90C1C3|nr:hypothetical protein [Salinicola sp. DM10]MCE3025710.1 hypothetical protein [Salinicola sp. DM10]